MHLPLGSSMIVSLALLASCAGKPAAPAPCTATSSSRPGVELATDARATELIEQACACATDACRQQVATEIDGLVLTFASAMTMQAGLTGCTIALVLEELDQLRRDACGCQDAACADDVQARFDAFMERHRDTQSSSAQAERAGEIAEAMMACLAAVPGGSPMARGGR